MTLWVDVHSTEKLLKHNGPFPSSPQFLFQSESKAPFTLQKKMIPDRKKVGTDQIFLPCKPSVLCLHEMDPDSLFSGFGAIGAYGPKTEKKTSADPFCCSKRCVNTSSFRAHIGSNKNLVRTPKISSVNSVQITRPKGSFQS